MQGYRKLTLAVLIALCVCLAATVWAQRVKSPSYVWEATLPTLLEEAFDIYAPVGFVFNSSSGARVGVGYIAPDPKSTSPTGLLGQSGFSIRLEVPAPQWGFIGFRNFSMKVAPVSQGPCRYPQFDVNGMAMAVPMQPSPGCVVEYLGGAGGVGHIHPSGGYGRRLVVDVRALGVDYREIPVGDRAEVSQGALMIAVYRDEACKTVEDPYSGVGLSLRWETGPVIIDHPASDTWEVEFTLPTWVYEYFPQDEVVDRRGRVTCGSPVLVGRTGTNPVHGRMRLIRHIVQ